MNRKKPVTGFSVIPYSLMNAIQDVNVWGVYGCVYRHGHNSEQGCWASVKTLHEETGMSIKLVQRSLSWLVENRWLTAQVRLGYTTVYHVTPLSPVENDCTHPNGKRLTPSMENDCPRQSKTTDPPSRKRLTNKNPVTRTQEQEPINKNNGASAEIQKKDPNRLKTLPAASVPPDLQDSSALLIEFWSCKKGVRSTNVLTRICNKLRKMTPQQRQDALERAIASGWGDVFIPAPKPAYSAIQEPQAKHPASRVFTADRGFHDEPPSNPILSTLF